MPAFNASPQNQITVSIPIPSPVAPQQQQPKPQAAPVYQPSQQVTSAMPPDDEGEHKESGYTVIIPHSGAGLVKPKKTMARGGSVRRYALNKDHIESILLNEKDPHQAASAIADHLEENGFPHIARAMRLYQKNDMSNLGSRDLGGFSTWNAPLQVHITKHQTTNYRGLHYHVGIVLNTMKNYRSNQPNILRLAHQTNDKEFLKNLIHEAIQFASPTPGSFLIGDTYPESGWHDTDDPEKVKAGLSQLLDDEMRPKPSQYSRGPANPARVLHYAKPAGVAGKLVGASEAFPKETFADPESGKKPDYVFRPMPKFFIPHDKLIDSAYSGKVGMAGRIKLKPGSELYNYYNAVGDHNYVALADPHTGNVHHFGEIFSDPSSDRSVRHLELIGDPRTQKLPDPNQEMRAANLWNAYKTAIKHYANSYSGEPYLEDSHQHMVGHDLAKRDWKNKTIGQSLPMSMTPDEHFQLHGIDYSPNGGWKDRSGLPKTDFAPIQVPQYRNAIQNREAEIEFARSEAAERGHVIVHSVVGGGHTYGYASKREAMVVIAHPDGRTVHWRFPHKSAAGKNLDAAWSLNHNLGRLHVLQFGDPGSGYRRRGSKEPQYSGIGQEPLRKFAESILDAAEKFKMLTTKRHALGRWGLQMEKAINEAASYRIAPHPKDTFGHTRSGHLGTGYQVVDESGRLSGKLYPSLDHAEHDLGLTDEPHGGSHYLKNGTYGYIRTDPHGNKVILKNHDEGWLRQARNAVNRGSIRAAQQIADYIDEHGGDSGKIRELLKKLPKRVYQRPKVIKRSVRLPVQLNRVRRYAINQNTVESLARSGDPKAIGQLADHFEEGGYPHIAFALRQHDAKPESILGRQDRGAYISFGSHVQAQIRKHQQPTDKHHRYSVRLISEAYFPSYHRVGLPIEFRYGTNDKEHVRGLVNEFQQYSDQKGGFLVPGRGPRDEQWSDDTPEALHNGLQYLLDESNPQE